MPTSKASSSSCWYRRVRAIIVEVVVVVVVADVCSPATIETMLILVVAATLLSKTHTLEQKLQHQNRVSFCDGPFRQRLILRTRQNSPECHRNEPPRPTDFSSYLYHFFFLALFFLFRFPSFPILWTTIATMTNVIPVQDAGSINWLSICRLLTPLFMTDTHFRAAQRL